MGAAVKIWQCYLISFFVTIILNNCQGCSPFTTINEISVIDTLTKTTLDAVKKVYPVFNESTVANFDLLNEQFNSASNNEDIHLNITQILNKYGYRTETHEVQTSDGYLLTLFRIPGNGKTVLTVHGLLCSADVFATTGPDRGLAFNLADQGYDVWLANTRGSTHSRKHIELTPECAEFWDFSWDELGRYDLPATIDYILEVTGQEQLAYVGYAQGCTSYFVMASEFPEYNNKISVMVAMSAVAYIKHCTSAVLNLLAPIADPLYLLTKTAGVYDIAPRNPITDLITTTACGTPLTADLVCLTPLLVVFGFDYSQVNATILPVFFGHFPAGASTKQLIHYLQLINSGEFENFNYGIVGNLKKYGSESPPDYPVGRITSKIAVIYSDSDVLSSTPDRERLLKQLPNVVETYKVPHTGFLEGDYLVANDLKNLVNDRVVEFINKYG